MKLIQTLKKIQIINFNQIIPTVLSTLNREWWDRALRKQEAAEALTPSDVVSTTRLKNGERFRFVCGSSRIDLEVEFLKETMVRLSWGNDRPPLDYAQSKKEWGIIDLNHRITDDEYIITSEKMELSVSPDGGIRFLDRNHNLVTEMLPPEFLGKSSVQRTLLHPTSAVYGLGERSSRLNLRPGSYQLWNTEVGGNYGPGQDPLYICIPFLVVLQSSGCFLIFYENSYRGSITISESLETRFEGGMLRYYLITGTLADVLAQYTELTGKPELPPIWALGYHHSKWGYKSADEILKIVDTFQKNELPISAIHLDIDYMHKYKVFTIDRKRFPDMKGFTKQLEKRGIHTVAIIDPAIKADPKERLFQEGIKNDYFCTTPSGKIYFGAVWPGKAAFPDFTNPAVRAWWSKQYKLLLDEGIAGFWHDMNEPSSFTAWGEMRPSQSMQHSMEGQKGNHIEARNVYGLLMNQAGYEGFRSGKPQSRPWLLSRSGWAGIQRYAWNWTGDVEASWRMLRQTIATILNLSLSGQPYCGADIGGFSGSPSPELYLRWLQMSCFLPFFRTHSSKLTPPREPWTFGEPILSIIREFLRLRYRLIPYLYSLAWEASKLGAPLIRPLFWLDPSNQSLWEIDDEFLLGDALLIAPLLEESSHSRSLLLPKGMWYPLSEDNPITGPTEISIEVSLEKLPVYVQGNHILPLRDQETLILEIYPDLTEKGEFEKTALKLYSDEGDDYPLTEKDWRLDTFIISKKNNQLMISRQQKGEFPWPYKNLLIKLHGLECTKALVDQKPATLYNGGLQTEPFNEIVFILPE